MTNDNLVIALTIVSALLAVSEALSLNSKIKANGIFQAVVNVIKMVKGFLTDKEVSAA